YVENHLLRRRSHGPRRVPHIARRIEDLIAADQQLMMRTASQAGWPARLHRVRRLDLGSRRIDAHDPADMHVWTYLRDGEIEPVGGGVPDRLFGAILRINAIGRSQRDARPDGEGAVGLIDLDEGGERRMAGELDIIDH